MGKGADPADAKTFDPARLPVMRQATADLSWLRERGYAEQAALTLVGDRFQLTKRQRQAIMRCALGPTQRRDRRSRRVSLKDLKQPLAIDGFNVLITLERALSGGPVLRGMDGAWRDLASVHGSWRRGLKTSDAIEAAALTLGEHPTTWILDRPVSNSGKLATSLRHHADVQGLPWAVELADQADTTLLHFEGALATSDGGILDQCGAWVSLEEEVMAAREVWLIDFT